jgi:hypothetical protein
MEAKLFLDKSNDPITIYQFDFGFTQYTDETGKTVGNPTGGTINMVVAATSDTTLIDWMLSRKGLKDGRIEIDSQKRVIKFEKAECIQYHESFSHLGGDENVTISFTISVETLKIGNVPPFKQKRKQQ